MNPAARNAPRRNARRQHSFSRRAFGAAAENSRRTPFAVMKPSSFSRRSTVPGRRTMSDRTGAFSPAPRTASVSGASPVSARSRKSARVMTGRLSLCSTKRSLSSSSKSTRPMQAAMADSSALLQCAGLTGRTDSASLVIAENDVMQTLPALRSPVQVRYRRILSLFPVHRG